MDSKDYFNRDKPVYFLTFDYGGSKLAVAIVKVSNHKVETVDFDIDKKTTYSKVTSAFSHSVLAPVKTPPSSSSVRRL